METINVIAMNLNMTGKNGSGTAQRKSNIVKAVFENYRNQIFADNGTAVTMGKPTMFSYRPIRRDHDYKSFVKYYIDFYTTEPCILIFQSLLDLADRGDTAYHRLCHLLHKENIRAIYFSDYSVSHAADSYLEYFDIIFIKEHSETRILKNTSCSMEFEQYLRSLRKLEPPVNFPSITSFTGISSNMLRRIVGKDPSRNIQGRGLTEQEKEEIKYLLTYGDSSMKIYKEKFAT